jgi:phosphate transport system protein
MARLPHGAPKGADQGGDADGRASFAAELRHLEGQALGGLDLVGEQLRRLIEVIRAGDRTLALQVIDDDDCIDGRYLEVHQSILSLLARQAPVAADLRLVAALLQVVGHVERMGDQCVNVAKLLPEVDERPGAELLDQLEEMCVRATELLDQAGRAFAGRDVALAEDLVRADDAIDHLNRACFRLALDLGEDPARREGAMHVMLAARCVERLADNAVDIGEQTAFMVSGLFREFTDASRPRGAIASMEPTP